MAEVEQNTYTPPRWRYNEGANLAELEQYVAATYGQHYGNDKDEVQLFDYWNSLGILGTVARATAMKYLICRNVIFIDFSDSSQCAI